MPPNWLIKVKAVSEECFRNLPPPVRRKFRTLLTDNVDEILHLRPSVVRERRTGRQACWRLYLESGSGARLVRRRVYLGLQGGPELRKAILMLRETFSDKLRDPKAVLAVFVEQEAREVRENRKAAKAARAALLAQTYQHLHGRKVRARRIVSSEHRYRAEFAHISRMALEKATWPGITEDDYIRLRAGTPAAAPCGT